MKTTLIWCGSVITASAVAVAFLFLTFQTNAQAALTATYFGARLDAIEKKIDKILEQ